MRPPLPFLISKLHYFFLFLVIKVKPQFQVFGDHGARFLKSRHLNSSIFLLQRELIADLRSTYDTGIDYKKPTYF